MAVPEQTPYNIYTANGVTTVFPYEFYILQAGDLAVSINGVSVTTGFTVSGVGTVNGGEVTFLVAPAAGGTVMLERSIPAARTTDYQDNGDLLADTVNKDFDRIWMAIRQAFISLGLALTRPLFGGPFNAKGYRVANLGDPVNDQDAATKKWTQGQDYALRAKTLRVSDVDIPPLPSAAVRANKVPAFDSAGNPTVMVPVSGSAVDVLIQLASSDETEGDSLIAVKQPCTGAVARTQHDKNTEWVSARDFGAVGDGVTDDTAALQAAFNYASPTDYATLFPLDNWNIRRRKLFIPAGFYKTTAPLLVGHGAYVEFEGEDFWLLKKSGRRAIICPEFENQLDWCIKSATYNTATGALLPYDGYVTGEQIDSNIYNQTFVTIKNLSILPTTRIYGGLKITGGPHSRIENFDIQRCDYSIWMSASWCAKLSGISYHIRAGICCLDSENGASVDVRSEGYWDASLNPLPGGYDIFGSGSIWGAPVSANQRLGVFVNLAETIHFPRLTAAGEHVGIYARLSNVSIGSFFAENITRYSIYGYRGQFDIGVLGGISGGPFSFLASGSSARIGAWKRADAVVPTMDFLHSDNLTQTIQVNFGLHYFNKQVIYGDYTGVIYVSAASGNDNYTGFSRAYPVATLDAALLRIVSLLNDGISPYKKVTINVLDGNQTISAIRTIVGVDVTINANSTSITFASGMYLTLGDNVRLRINAATIIPTAANRLFYISSLQGTSVSLYNCTTQLDAIAGEAILFYVDHFVLAESLRVISGSVTTNANSKVVSCPSLVNQTNFIKLIQVNAAVSGAMAGLSNKGVNFTPTYIGHQILSY